MNKDFKDYHEILNQDFQDLLDFQDWQLNDRLCLYAGFESWKLLILKIPVQTILATVNFG